jgi:hypothetical protein
MELKFNKIFVETPRGNVHFFDEVVARQFAAENCGTVHTEAVCVDSNKLSTARLIWLAENGNKAAEMQLNVRINALPHRVSVLSVPDWNGGHRPGLTGYVEDVHDLPDFTYIEAEGNPRDLMDMVFSAHAEPFHEDPIDWEVSFPELMDSYLFGWDARWLY